MAAILLLGVGSEELGVELRCERQMNDGDAQQRLEALMAAIHHPSITQAPIHPGESSEGADAHRMATTQIDELLRRVAALTGLLGSGDSEWDDVDRIAAQLLLADPAAVASTTRALNSLAASRLSAALADLVAARRDAERTVQEAG